MNTFETIWFFGFMFTAGLVYYKTKRGKYIFNLLLIAQCVLYWPAILGMEISAYFTDENS